MINTKKEIKVIRRFDYGYKAVDDSDDDSDENKLKQLVSQLKTFFTDDNNDFDEFDFNIKLADSEDIFSSKIYTTDDLMAFERSKLEQTEFDILCKEEDGRISLAYEQLPGIPKKVAERFASRTHTLDLSYNNIKDLTFLCNFKTLHTLILDNNTMLNEKTMPFIPSLRILWLNKCGISNLSKWIQRLKVCTPNIRQLSLMGNPGAHSLFNGGSLLENNDYIMYVIGNLTSLEYLDDIKITDAQRTVAKTHVGVYTMSGTPIKFMERFTNSPNLLTFFKYDPKRHRPQMASLVTTRPSYRSKPSTLNGRQ